jgi:carbonic anhydrase
MNRHGVRLDLGLRSLLPEWKSMLARDGLKDDVVAGLTVACVAVPLSLAIALASGVPPAVGLVTAIVAGVVCALFGGTRLAVSGPAAAMAILVGTIVTDLGLAALLVIGVGCGVLQIATGVFRLGRFVRLVPLPVIEGFTAGIGAIILIGQLPRALGLPAPPASHVFDVVTHIGELLHQTRPAAVALTLGSLVIILGLPLLTRRVPSHLAGVVVATVLVAVFRIDAATIGEIPRSLPLPEVPAWPRGVAVGTLVGSTFVVYALASLETLLSSAAVDKMAVGPRSDPDQELIGQGLGNAVSAVFGGIPVTGVIARSATNVLAGAKTRRSAIIHSLALVLTVLAFASYIGRIPIAALAAVLFAVAFRMLDPRVLLRLWRQSRTDGLVFAITFLVIVFVDLLEGVQWGVVAALVIAAIRLGRTRLTVLSTRIGEHDAFKLDGPLTFMSSLGIEKLRAAIDALEPGRSVVIDVGDVKTMDSSGAEMLAGLVEHARSSDHRVAILGLAEEHRARLLGLSGGQELGSALVASELGLSKALGDLPSADLRLRMGVERYRSSLRPRYAQLFEQLADGQAPHTMFITCCDSRVSPNLITSTEPGELFILREIGNMVPPDGAVQGSPTGAAIEYAVGVLGVRKIVVCGHSGCGAIKAILASGDRPQPFPNLEAWLQATDVRSLVRAMPHALSADEVARLNVLAQADHLRTYEVVRQAVDKGELSLATWFFDVGAGDLEEWSDRAQAFLPVGSPEPPSARPDRASGGGRGRSRRPRQAKPATG